MANANIIFSNDFSGVGYPTFEAWPFFEVLPGQSAFIAPVVDGKNHGLATRTHNLYSVLRSTQYPGRANCKYQITAKWSNPGFSSNREIGLCARMQDRSNFLVARLRSMGTASPELRLFKVIGGAATQLGSTYTGSAISATQLAVGVSFRLRVEDLTDEDGSTTVSVYTGSTLSDNGDERITWTGDLSTLRGDTGTCGIEIGSLWKGSEILVSDLLCLDFADEWTAPAPEPGQGWTVELDGTLFTTAQLAALDPPIELGWVQQELGLAGNSCELRVKGKFHTGLLRPGQPCRIWHDGKAVFNGRLTRASITASPSEQQVFSGADAATLGRQVLVEEDDGSGTVQFNVYDGEADEYRGDRQSLTIGEIIQYFFDSYTDGTENLRFYGAAPASGPAYVLSELNLMAAVVPDVAVSGNFTEVILTLLSYAQRYQLWIDPEDNVWHFRDVLDLTGETVALTSEWATLSIEPDYERPNTAILWRGAKKQSEDGVTLKLSDGTLKPAWTSAQEASWTKDKAKKSVISLRVLSAGSYAIGEGPTSASMVYVDVATGSVDEDDWRGALASFTGDAFNRFVTTHTSTRISFGAPAWGDDEPPAPGTTVIFNLVDPEAAWWMSMQGVGRGVILIPPASLCPQDAAHGYKNHLKNQGMCGEAWVTEAGSNPTSAQAYAYQVHFPTAAQSQAGFCGIYATLAEKAKPPLSTIVFWKDGYGPPPGGSPPKSLCEPGQPPIEAMVDIQIRISTTTESVPSFRLPPEEGTFEGTAFSTDETLWGTTGRPKATDWGVQRVYVVDDPDFVDAAVQAEGLKEAAQAWLDLHSQKFYAFTITLSTPWFTEVPDFITSGLAPGGAVPSGLRPPGGATTTRWAGLHKKVSLTSTKRATGYEAAALPVFSVRWLVPEQKTVLQAGSATAILKADAATLAKGLTAKAAARRAARMIKELEDWRNRNRAKRADRVGGQQAGTIDGCDVAVNDHNTFTRKSVELDDQQKKARQNYDSGRGLLVGILFHGIETTHPGTQIGSPGFDISAAKQVVPGAGPALGSYADHRFAFQGPTSQPNGNKSKFGGMIGADEPDSYNPPDYLGKYGPYIFRMKPNAAETPGGGIGIEWSPMDAAGAPTGVWADLTKATDLPGNRTPWSAVTEGSIDYQLRAQTAELARGLGRVEDSVGALQQPGNETPSHPDGVPADLASMLRTPGVANPFLQPVPHTFTDPGGLVLEGPMTDGGATAGLFWRVASPENVLMRVERVPAGTGSNGGSWAPVLVNGGAYEFATSLRVEHKQAHARDLASSGADEAGNPLPVASPPAMSADPFCTTAQAGRVLTGALKSAASAVIRMPDGARGIPLATAHLEEDANDSSQTIGNALAVRFAYAYRSSPWGAVETTDDGTGLTADGSGTATGQFKKPFGAVPPGLRKPFDLAVQVQTVPGSSTYDGNAVLRGIDIDIAVVEGGYWVRWKQGIGVSDQWSNNHPWYSDVAIVEDVWTLEFTKGWVESCECSDNWSAELNCPICFEELCMASDEWTVELNP